MKGVRALAEVLISRRHNSHLFAIRDAAALLSDRSSSLQLPLP